MSSYYRNCKHCGNRIQLREMPAGQWLAFEGFDTPHECSVQADHAVDGRLEIRELKRPPSGQIISTEKVRQVVREAIAGRRVVRIVYESQHRGYPDLTTREIEPLKEVRGQFEAYCRLRQDLRNFRFDRIKSIEGTGESFQPRSVVSAWSSRPERAAVSATPTNRTSNAGCIWSVVVLGALLLWLL
jgi:predicted DNA-binding transcriptional regulator YafY